MWKRCYSYRIFDQLKLSFLIEIATECDGRKNVDWNSNCEWFVMDWHSVEIFADQNFNWITVNRKNFRPTFWRNGQSQNTFLTELRRKNFGLKKIPTDFLTDGSVTIYIYTHIYTYIYTHIHICVYVYSLVV